MACFHLQHSDFSVGMKYPYSLGSLTVVVHFMATWLCDSAQFVFPNSSCSIGILQL